MTVWRYSLFLWLHLAQLESEHPWLKTNLASAAITLSKKGVLLQDAFGGKNYGVSGVISSLTLTELFLNIRQSTLICPAAHNSGSTEDQNTSNRRGVVISLTELCILLWPSVRKAATCPAKPLAGRNSVIVPNTTCMTVPALLRTQAGVKVKVGLKNQFQGRVKAGEQLAHPGQIWVKNPKPKKLLCTENAHVPPKAASLPVLKSHLEQ